MEMKQSQIKINLSNVLREMVEKRAKKYGATLAGYTKYLMMKDIEESEDLKPSASTLKAMKLAKSGKAKWSSPSSIEELDKMVDSVK